MHADSVNRASLADADPPPAHHDEIDDGFTERERTESRLISRSKRHYAGMRDVTEKPRQRIPSRVSASVRDTLEQAAELLGATVNQFAIQAAYLEVQRVIERESVIRLSQVGAPRVVSALDNPPKPNNRLKDAVKIGLFSQAVRMRIEKRVCHPMPPNVLRYSSCTIPTR